MSRLAGKFIFSLSAVLMALIVVSIFLNSNFIGRYFLYLEKQDMNRICDLLVSGTEDLAETAARLEETEDIVIAWVKGSEDNIILNERLRNAFLNKGISLDQYWLWDQDQQDVMRDGRKMRIYYQEKLHYSLLVEYLYEDGIFIAAAKIVPSVSRTVSLVNRVTGAVFTGAGLIMILVIIVLVKRITTPLLQIGKTAKSIAGLDFQKIQIHTNDELEVLADDINHMSDQLLKAHGELERKNRQMEELLANVSHDLKTPVALIKAYAGGIKDGMDDGTFLDTIIRQNERMEQMIKRLLDLAKAGNEVEPVELVDISCLLRDMVSELQIQAEAAGISFICQIEDSLEMEINSQAVRTIFSNLLSNAVAYSSGTVVEICLNREEGHCCFQTKNKTEYGVQIDTEHLWDPFYVAEESRNKTLSGTGLGLSIVRAVSEKYGFSYSCNLTGNIIIFMVIF